MQSKITLRAMYNYDNTLFDNLQFPAGIDSDLAISRIINKSEEFEVLYADIDYMKDRIGIWGEIWNRTFKKWVDALAISYDPLFNYDRTEIYTDTHSKDYADKHNKNFTDSHSREFADSHSNSVNDNAVRNYADNTAETSDSLSSTVTGSETSSNNEQKHSAYDEADYSKRDKETGSATTNQTGNGSASGSLSRDNTGNETNTKNSNESANNSGSEFANNAGGETNNTSGNSNEIVKHSARMFGNIGVTTSQQMLESELKIAEWNLYEHIADIFIDEFCILVY